MKSVADDLRHELRAQVRAMSPEARIELAQRLGREALAVMVSALGVTEAEARERLRRARQAGRTPSRCMSGR